MSLNLGPKQVKTDNSIFRHAWPKPSPSNPTSIQGFNYAIGLHTACWSATTVMGTVGRTKDETEVKASTVDFYTHMVSISCDSTGMLRDARTRASWPTKIFVWIYKNAFTGIIRILKNFDQQVGSSQQLLHSLYITVWSSYLSDVSVWWKRVCTLSVSNRIHIHTVISVETNYILPT